MSGVTPRIKYYCSAFSLLNNSKFVECIFYLDAKTMFVDTYIFVLLTLFIKIVRKKFSKVTVNRD